MAVMLLPFGTVQGNGIGMKIRLRFNDDELLEGFLVEPETSVDKQILRRFDGATMRSWIKNGLTPRDMIGLVIEQTGIFEQGDGIGEGE